MSILLGVTGSISAYKIPELIRRLIKKQISVTPLLTRSATEFVTKLTLATVSQTPVYTDDDYFQPEIPHLSLLDNARLFVVAPATANFIAKAANGIADDLLTASFLSYTGPKLIVPAMHIKC